MVKKPEWPSCELCEKISSTFSQDFKELSPINGWFCAEPLGIHFYCDEHYKPSQTYRIDGTVELTFPIDWD